MRGGSELGSYEDLMKALAAGGSFCCCLRGSEALGSPDSNEVKRKGGTAKEAPHVRGVCGRGGRVGELDLMNVWRILALGGSICRVLRGSEALGGLSF